MSIDDWLTDAEVTGWFRRLLDVAYTTEFGLETGEQSALNLLYLIDPAPSPFRVFGDSDERFHVRGGNDRLVTALSRPLEHAIELGTQLEALSRRADGQYELTLRRDSGLSTVSAPHVVLALPFTLLRRVALTLPLPDVKRRAIDGLGYGTNAKLMVGFESRPWRERSNAAGEVFTDLPFQCLWETSRGQPGCAGILTNYTGGRQGILLGEREAESQAARLTSQLEAVFPGVVGARGDQPAVRFHWPSHAWSRGSFACYRPGQWTSLRGAEGARVANLHFVGEHCSAEFQGYMEGAVETGEAAAHVLLSELGARIPAARMAGMRM